MYINLLNNIITKMGVFLISFYILSKSINHKISFNQKIFLFLWCLSWTIFNIAPLLWIPLLFNIIYCATTIFFLWKILKIKLDTAASAYMLSYGLSYSLYFITSLLITLIFVPFLGTENYNQSPVDFDNPIYLLIYILVASLQFIMARRLFKIKRFKDGFPFLFEKYTIIITLIITGIVMVIVSILSSPREIYDSYIIFIMLVSGIIIAGIGTIIWIRRGITMSYKKD